MDDKNLKALLENRFLNWQPVIRKRSPAVSFILTVLRLPNTLTTPSDKKGFSSH